MSRPENTPAAPRPAWSPHSDVAYIQELNRLSVMMVDPDDHLAAEPESLLLRRGNLEDATEEDDVVILCGAGAGHRVRELAERFGRTMPRVVVIVPTARWDDIRVAIDHGATSYVIEDERPTDPVVSLAQLVVWTATGVNILAPTVGTALADAWQNQRRPAGLTRPSGSETGATPIPLTGREIEVMQLVADGCTSPEIASRLSLSNRTIRNYLSRIYAKLQVHRQSEAMLAWLGHPVREKEQPTASTEDGPTIRRAVA